MAEQSSCQINDAISIRTFLGAIDFDHSRSFYRDFGFEETILSESMSYFALGQLGFYLQRYYVRDWVDNSMVFLEVEDLASYHRLVMAKQLTESYPTVRISEIHERDWGGEFFVHDPAGVLWHIGSFSHRSATPGGVEPRP